MQDNNMLEPIADSVADQVLMVAGAGMLCGVKRTARDVFALALGDRVSEWRIRNLLTLVENTAIKFEQRGIQLSDAKSLPNSELYALFEGASRTDEPSVQELWEGLMASAMTPGKTSGARVGISSVLAQMDVHDAKMFKFFTEAIATMRCFGYWPCKLRKALSDNGLDDSTIDEITSQFAREQRALAASLNREMSRQTPKDKQTYEDTKANLLRLRLISPTELPFDEFDFRDPLDWEQMKLGGVDHISRSEEFRDFVNAGFEQVFRSAHFFPKGHLIEFGNHSGGLWTPFRLHYFLTDLGQQVAEACEIDSNAREEWSFEAQQ